MTDEEVSRRRFLRFAGAGVLGGIAGCTSPVGTRDATTPTESGEQPTAPGDATSGGSQYTDVYRQVIDSVVLVRVYTAFGRGHGSGFVYRTGGYVLTNQHVVANAERIEIRFNRGEWRTADIVGTDVYSDLAVLRVVSPPDYADPLDLVASDPPVGAKVLAIGNPFQFEKTVSAGIVSGVNRSIQVNPARRGGFSIPDAVQTDAAVNPGNSGGPLVDMDGEVIGIIRSGGGENIGFAVSAALIRRVAPELIADGEYEHSYMGVTLLPVSPVVAEANDLPEPRGVLVASVRPGGPSDGVLQPSTGEATVDGIPGVPTGGDVIVRMGDRRIDTLNDLSTFLALETRPGETIPIRVIRNGERTTVDLTLGERPEPGT